MTSTHDIIRAIGTRRAAEALAVGEGAIRAALSRGPLPPAWFDTLERMCVEIGQECPRSAFGFRSYHTNGSAPASRQGEAAE